MRGLIAQQRSARSTLARPGLPAPAALAIGVRTHRSSASISASAPTTLRASWPSTATSRRRRADHGRAAGRPASPARRFRRGGRCRQDRSRVASVHARDSAGGRVLSFGQPIREPAMASSAALFFLFLLRPGGRRHRHGHGHARVGCARDHSPSVMRDAGMAHRGQLEDRHRPEPLQRHRHAAALRCALRTTSDDLRSRLPTSPTTSRFKGPCG